MRACYADPPYIGQARKLYRCAEIDHVELIARLERDFDTWALSLSTPTLVDILPLVPRPHRVLAWVKPFCAFKPGQTLAYAWEPVVLRGARKRPRSKPTVRDWVSANITLRRGLCGAKPEAFSFWLFEAMGLEIGDEFVDLFPGSGAVSDAWTKWTTGGGAAA